MTPRERVLELKAHYGSWWKGALATGMAYEAFYDIGVGRTKNPGSHALAALGLEKKVTYTLIDKPLPPEVADPPRNGRELLEAAKQRARISCTDTSDFY